MHFIKNAYTKQDTYMPDKEPHLSARDARFRFKIFTQIKTDTLRFRLIFLWRSLTFSEIYPIVSVVRRWMQKISVLQQKKTVYGEILKRQLDDLNQDYMMLKMQSNELMVRNSKDQLKLDLAA